ncbi:MAG: terminase [Gammaproteobacteria bacterium]|nr:terminase [Gammaproteobacteria bacterium]
MSNFDPIDDALDIESEIIEQPKKAELPQITNSNDDLEVSDTSDDQKDYEYTRQQLYTLIEKGQEAVTGALELAQEGGSARSYEVALNGVKSMSEVAEKLMDLQKKVKDLDAVTVNNNQTNVTNNSVFVGSTTELQKMIKEGMMKKLTDS